MAQNPDPKYGRWILPVVIAGMVGATWIFVSSLEPGTVPDSTATTAASEDTIATTTVPETTTTTLAPEVAAYLAQLDALALEAEGLLERARDINNAWDQGETSFQDTADALRTLVDDTEAFDARVQESATVPELEASHLLLNDAAASMVVAAQGMVDGLLDPDTAEGRIQAFADYQAATDAFMAGVQAVKQRAGVASELVTETPPTVPDTEPTVPEEEPTGDESGTTIDTTPAPED